MTKPIGEIHPKYTYVMGVDMANMGNDSTVICVLEEGCEDGKIYCVYLKELYHKKTTEIVGFIKALHQKFNFKRIYVDATGLGIGPTESLQEGVGHIVQGVSFTVQSKMDMYSNVKELMTKGRLRLPSNKKLLFQLLDLRYEMMSSGKLQLGSMKHDMKIHHSQGGYDDYCDALALSAWYFHGVKREGLLTIA